MPDELTLYGDWSPVVALAERLCRSALVPSPYRNRPDDALAAILLGQGLGLDPMTSLLQIDVIQGRPSPRAVIFMALAHQHAGCERFELVESTPEACVWETMRTGNREPTRLRWTLDDAKRMGLLGKDNWKKDPSAMLRARCGAALARAVYPDATLGYLVPEEVEDQPRAVHGERVHVEPEALPSAQTAPAESPVWVSIAAALFDRRITAATSRPELTALAKEIHASGLGPVDLDGLRRVYEGRYQALPEVLDDDAPVAPAAQSEVRDGPPPDRRPFDEVAALVSSAPTQTKLDALKEQCSRFGEPDRGRLRAGWVKRRAELIAQAERSESAARTAQITSAPVESAYNVLLAEVVATVATGDAAHLTRIREALPGAPGLTAEQRADVLARVLAVSREMAKPDGSPQTRQPDAAVGKSGDRPAWETDTALAQPVPMPTDSPVLES